jgi:hypothetical protein
VHLDVNNLKGALTMEVFLADFTYVTDGIIHFRGPSGNSLIDVLIMV